MPTTNDPTGLPPGAVRTEAGPLLTVASQATNERVAPVTPKLPFSLPPVVGSILAILALLCGAPVAIAAAFTTGGLSVPAWLTTAAIVGGGLTPILTGLAFWSRGTDPFTLLQQKQAAAAEPAQKTLQKGPPEP